MSDHRFIFPWDAHGITRVTHCLFDMTTQPSERRTSIAILKKMRHDQIEVQYQHGIVLSIASLAEVKHARRELMGHVPYSMLSILPDDVNYTMPAMSVDHLADDRKEGDLLAIAIVAHANMMEMILKLYFSYFPQLTRIKVTSSEAEARQWLHEQMEELGRSES